MTTNTKNALPAGYEIRYMHSEPTTWGTDWVECAEDAEGATPQLFLEGRRCRTTCATTIPALTKVALRNAHDAALEARWTDAAVRACQGRYVLGELAGFGVGSLVIVRAFGKDRPGVVTEVTATRMRVLVTTPSAIEQNLTHPNTSHAWHKLPAGV